MPGAGWTCSGRSQDLPGTNQPNLGDRHSRHQGTGSHRDPEQLKQGCAAGIGQTWDVPADTRPPALPGTTAAAKTGVCRAPTSQNGAESSTVQPRSLPAPRDGVPGIPSNGDGAPQPPPAPRLHPPLPAVNKVWGAQGLGRSLFPPLLGGLVPAELI